MVEQDITKIKKEYESFLAPLKELIDALEHIISAGKVEMARQQLGTFIYYKYKLEVLDAQARLVTKKQNLESHLYSFNNYFLPQYKEQVEDCEKNFDALFSKAKAIIEKNDIKTKNFDIVKQIIDGYKNPENQMDLKLLSYDALKKVL